MDTLDAIRSYLSTETASGVDMLSIGVDEDLLVMGVVDSMTLLKLVSFIEDKFDVKVLDEDISKQNFRSLTSLTSFIAFKQSES